jgi:transposase
MSQRPRKSSYWRDAPLPRQQLVLFPVTIEERIPADHPVRLFDEILNRLDWTEWESAYDGRHGQPPIHPSVLCKVLLFAMIRQIRSSRQIEYNLKHSIDLIWLASGHVIDHTTLSEFRRRHAKQIRSVYRQVTNLAVKMGLAHLSELCVDGTRILANASRYHTLTVKRVERMLAELDAQMAEALRSMDEKDELDQLLFNEESADQLPEELRDPQVRREKLEAALALLLQMDEQRRQEGIDPKKNPAQLPAADYDSRVLPNKEGGYAPNYTPMVVSETKNGFIVGADVVIGNVEHTMLVPLMVQLEEEFDTKSITVMADGAYVTGPNLSTLAERNVELLSPALQTPHENNPAQRDDPSQPVAAEDLDRLPINPQTKCFDKSAFIYDAANNLYYCPAGKKVTRNGSELARRSGVEMRVFRYESRECSGCPLAPRCLTNPSSKRGRTLNRDEYETIRREHSNRMAQTEQKERYKTRQHIGETPFAVLKSVLSFRRFLLRGIGGVRTEWLWGCTGFNLKKLMNLIGQMRAEQTLVPANAKG